MDIELSKNIDLPSALVAPELLRIFRAIENAKEPYCNFSLRVGLGKLATIAVPLDLKITSKHANAVREIDLHFSARTHKELFPAFTGRIRADALGASSSAIWFSGSYEAPLGVAGKAIDQTLLRGIAEQSLRLLLERVSKDAAVAIRAREQAAIRSAAFQH